MSTKLVTLKKRIISQAIKSGIMVLGCTIALSAAYYFYQSSEAEINKLQSRDRQLKQKIAQLQSNNSNAGKTLKLYKQLIKESKIKPLELNRKQISTLISSLSDSYRINNVNITIAPIKENKSGAFAQEAGTIITTEISIKFESPSDIHAFAFIDNLSKKFPGYLNIKSFDTQRTGEVSENTLRSLLKGGRANFIQNQITFSWLGLRPNVETKKGGS